MPPRLTEPARYMGQVLVPMEAYFVVVEQFLLGTMECHQMRPGG